MVVELHPRQGQLETTLGIKCNGMRPQAGSTLLLAGDEKLRMLGLTKTLYMQVSLYFGSLFESFGDGSSLTQEVL